MNQFYNSSNNIKTLGYLPEAMFNFIALLGWSPQGEHEIFSREEFIEIFDEKRLGKSPAASDPKKLEWINKHIREENTIRRSG